MSMFTYVWSACDFIWNHLFNPIIKKTYKINESILYAKSWDHSMKQLKFLKEKGSLRSLVPEMSNNSHITMTFSRQSCHFMSSNQKLWQNNKLRLPHWKLCVIFPCQTYIAIGAIIQLSPNSPNMYTRCS